MSIETQATLTVRRIDGAYRAVVTHDDLEATHLVPLSRTAAWQLAAHVAKAFAEGRDLDLQHWDTDTIDWSRRR